MNIKIIFCFIVILCSLVSCFSIRPLELPADQEMIAFKPLKLEMSYDIYHIRIDLNRQTTTRTETTTDADGKTVTKTVTQDVPYHYLGVDLGNGLFLDARLNLSINLIKMLNLEEYDYFKVTYKATGLFDSEAIYEKDGNDVTIKIVSIFSGESHITLKENGAVIQGGFLQSRQDIIMNENEIVYDPHSVFGDWSLTRIIKTPNGLKIPGFWKDFEMVHNADGSVSLGDNLMITPVGKKISIIFSGFFGYKKEYTLMRTINKLFFYNENMYGFYIEIYKDGAVIDYGMYKMVFEIIKERR